MSLVLGVIVIVGWHTHNENLIQVNPAFVPMQYNTAMGFLLSGIALLALLLSFRIIAAFVGVGAIFIGSLTLVEYILGIDLHIDKIFMQHYIDVETPFPGRMAANTAFCFCLTGIALLFTSLKSMHRLTPIWTSALGAIIIALGVVALTGYLADIETAYGWGQWSKMGIHTATGFIILGIGLASFTWHISKKNSVEIPYWLPIFAGIGSMTITISLWQALDATEHHLPAEFLASSAFHADEAMLIFGLLLTIALVLAIWFAELSRKRLLIANRTESELRKSEAFNRAIVESAVDGIISIDSHGIVETFNHAAETIFGYHADEVVGRNINLLMPEPYHSNHDAYIKRVLDTGEAKTLGRGVHKVRGKRKNGSVFPLELTISMMKDNDEPKFTGIARDITHQELMQERIEKMAYYDPLTSLPNRSLHYDRLTQALAQGRRNKHNVAVFFLDLDNFKPINDELGHDYGDQALMIVAERLKGCIRRDTDTASRIGGDEFSIILGTIASLENISIFAEKIIASISQPILLNGNTYSLGCSIGVRIANTDFDDAESMMKASDNSMYQAKKNGGNCYHINKG